MRGCLRDINIEDNIKMNLKETERDADGYIHLVSAKDRNEDILK
jgi:hypothetical protein